MKLEMRKSLTVGEVRSWLPRLSVAPSPMMAFRLSFLEADFSLVSPNSH